MPVRFEWDEEGSCQYREARRRLDEASRVLSDSQVILREDRMVKGEERLHAIGYLRRPRRHHSYNLGSQSDARGKEVV
jgi:uncharacterized DUF497 family protein